MPRRLIIGMSGASGVIYGIRMLEVLREVPDVETHLVISGPARQTIALETTFELSAVMALADMTYRINNIGAEIASGSYQAHGMVIVPCSIRTLAGVAYCQSDNLLLRAADVTLKERRPLIMVVRETPLHLGHLRLMVQVAELGGIIMPPMPAFYQGPQSLDDIINQTVNRVLDQLGISLAKDLFPRWSGARNGKSMLQKVT